MKFSHLLPALLGSATVAFAAPAEFNIKQVEYGGSGCPAGTAAITVASDGKSFQIKMNEMTAESKTPKFPTRKQCGISIPVSVAPGYKIALLPTEYRGSASIAAGGMGTVAVETFVAGQHSPSVQKTFPENFSGEFKHVAPEAGQAVETGCGESATFRISASIIASGNPVATLNSSVSLANAGEFHFQAKRCN